MQPLSGTSSILQFMSSISPQAADSGVQAAADAGIQASADAGAQASADASAQASANADAQNLADAGAQDLAQGSKRKKGKRKINPDNRAWNKKQKSSNKGSKKDEETTNHYRLLPMRANNKATVEVPNEEKTAMIEEPLKTAAMLCPLSPLGFQEPLKSLLKAGFDLNQNKIKTARKIDQVIEWSPLGKTPRRVRTPGKTVLSLASNNGLIYGFSNGPARIFLSPKRKLEDPLAFESSSAAAAVKPNPHLIKHVKVFITATSLKLAQKEISENCGIREGGGQNGVMATKSSLAKEASATLYARAAKVASSEEQRWEWLHLIAHFILASKAQQENNLGAGTYHANTEMLSVELALKTLVKLFPQGFWLEVKAYCIPLTQILTTIEYLIKTEEFFLPFVFNAQEQQQPNIYNLSYMDVFVQTLKDIKAPPSIDKTLEPKNKTPTPKMLDFGSAAVKAMKQSSPQKKKQKMANSSADPDKENKDPSPQPFAIK
ncbi:MAG TPA: hypothetical protein VLH77_05910 [Gammaproteobacteria bacterium]|nr:hypothetical protein [Gammaproteobacteria bacterium]